jgi:chromosome segregation ATPase
LATARIVAAKQEAELRELRRQADELRQAAEAKETELMALRQERDRLERTATVAQVRVAEQPVLPASMADVHAIQTKLGELESALAALTAELAQVKREMRPSPASSPSSGEDKKVREKMRMKGKGKR